MREVESKLPDSLREHYAPYLLFFKDLLKQKRSDKNKCYSIHEPQVSCIAKGKAHKKYEFGCKVSVSRTVKKGVIVAMKCFEGNPYDGDTIEPTLQQLERIVMPLGGERPQKGHLRSRRKRSVQNWRHRGINPFKADRVR